MLEQHSLTTSDRFLLHRDRGRLAGKGQAEGHGRFGSRFLTGEWAEDVALCAGGANETALRVNFLVTFIGALEEGQGLETL